MKLVEFVPPTPHPLWKLCLQMGIEDVVVKVNPTLTGLPDPWKLSTLKKIVDNLKDHGLNVVALEGDPFDMTPIKQFGEKEKGKGKSEKGKGKSEKGEGVEREEAIAHYCELLESMSKLGIKLLCYNFMVGPGWSRTGVRLTRGGAKATYFKLSEFESSQPSQLSQPSQPSQLSRSQVWSNYEYFIKSVMPTAEKCGVRMGLHPDDPCLPSLGGYARIFETVADYDRAYEIYPSPSNAVTFCQANFKLMGADLVEAARHFGNRIAYIHVRDVEGDKYDFTELFHDQGTTDQFELQRVYREIGLDVPLRGDHVPEMEGDRLLTADAIPGYFTLGRLFANGYLKALLQSTLSVFMAAVLLTFGTDAFAKDEVSLTQWVNPFIGTLREGAAHPGATWPMGMVQPGPEVGTETPPPSGYRYQETVLQGFSQNRVMGTFWGCLHDVSLLPFVGAAPAFAKMDKKSERTEPGYYAVRLPDSEIFCELTCSERVAYHRYTFERGGTGRLLVDLGSGPLSTWGGDASKPPRVVASESSIGADGILSGHNVVKCNWPDRDLFYALSFSRPCARVTEMPPRPDGSPAKRYVLDFNLRPGESVVVKAALSSVDEKGARANLAADPVGFDFDARRRAARDAWEKVLGIVAVEGDPDRLTVFYTMIYQSYVQPQRIDDVDGRVRIAKNRVITVAKPFYTGFLDTWDTFRAAHPLYTILTPERAGLFAESLLAYPRNGEGGIPSNAVFARKRSVMPGSHGIPIVADAFLKGLLPDFTAADVFACLDKSVDWPEGLLEKGWYPLDPKHGCGQHLVLQLDEVVDAGAICEFSRRTGVGKERVARVHRPRAESWTNVFDVATGAMRPRNSQGAFVGPEPFDFFRQCLSPKERAARIPWGINEGGYAQWAWHVLGDPERRVALEGGPEKATAALDRIFRTSTDLPGQRRGYGCTGPVGQYFHGNEPTHHVPYYYQYAGRPDRTEEIVREICSKLYRNANDGMCGDGDSGQMGAWFVFSSLGFYPLNPVGGDYVLGAPQYPKMTLRVGVKGREKTFTVIAKGLSEKNLHVKSVMLNGKPLKGFILKHEQILAGGELVFEMCQ